MLSRILCFILNLLHHKLQHEIVSASVVSVIHSDISDASTKRNYQVSCWRHQSWVFTPKKFPNNARIYSNVREHLFLVLFRVYSCSILLLQAGCVFHKENQEKEDVLLTKLLFNTIVGRKAHLFFYVKKICEILWF